MLPWVCSVIDHRRRQNVVRTSVTHSAIASCATFLFLPHFDVICDLLVNRRTATWNLFVSVFSLQYNDILDWLTEISVWSECYQLSECYCKFNIHVKNKLVKAHKQLINNKCLYVLRSLGKEGYNQTEIDLPVKTILLPNFTYALSVFGASEPDLAPIQSFLDRSFKRRFVTKKFNIHSILESKITVFLKVSQVLSDIRSHLLCHVLRPANDGRNRTSERPKVHTERFQNSFFNRLIFKYHFLE